MCYSIFTLFDMGQRCCKISEDDHELMKADFKTTPRHGLDGQTFTGVLVDCYDGDTCMVAMKAYHQVELFKCRLIGLDTPEMNSQDPHVKMLAIEARNFLITQASSNPYTLCTTNRITVREHLSEHKRLLTVVCGKPDKYGRLLVTLRVPNNTMSVNEQLITNHIAKPYDGGKKDTIW